MKKKNKNFKINRKYRKLDKCNLPFEFYDKNKEKYEWVNYIKYIDNTMTYNRNKYLIDAIETICKVGITYNYNINNNCNNKNYQSHCHNFDSVLKELYFYPESFNIPDEFKEDYSKQELNFIEEIQKYLLFIKLKDFQYSKEYKLIEEKVTKIFSQEKINLIDKIKIAYLNIKSQKILYKNKLARCHNERQAKYQNYDHLILSKEKIKNIINNHQKFLIRYSPYFKNTKTFSSIGKKYLLKDENYNILASIEIMENQIIKFKDFKQAMAKEVKDFQNYKKALKKNYIALDKSFNDESLIVYEKIKVLEKY